MQHVVKNEAVLRKVAKVSNIVLCAGMAIAGFAFMFSESEAGDDGWLHVCLGFYVSVLSLVLFSLESKIVPDRHLQMIKKYFLFLMHPVGRGSLVFALALMLFAFGEFGIIIGSFLLFSVILNAGLMTKFPDFQTEQFGDIGTTLQLDEEQLTPGPTVYDEPLSSGGGFDNDMMAGSTNSDL
eukprot:g2467.t1